MSDLTEERIVERVAYSLWRAEGERAAPLVAARSRQSLDDFRDQPKKTVERWASLARAVLALLGPAPMVWGDMEPWGGHRRGICFPVPPGEAIIRDGDVWTYRGIRYDAPTLEQSLDAAKAAAEARHRAQWLAGTVLGQEGGA